MEKSMRYDFLLHLYCTKEKVNHRERLSEADFDPFVKDAIFSGLRFGLLPNNGEKYKCRIMPIWPETKTVGNPNSPSQSNLANGAVLGFKVIIKAERAMFRKKYPLLNFRNRALEKAIHSAPCGNSISTCGYLEYSIEAYRRNENPTHRKKNESLSGSRINIQVSTYLMKFDRKPFPYRIIFGSDHGSLSARLQRSQAPMSLIELQRLSGQEVDFPVYLKESLLREMRQHAQNNLDREVAGFLIGKVFQDENTSEIYAMIEDQIVARHTDGNQVKVTISSNSWMAFWEEMKQRRGNLQLLGWWHSHPFEIQTGSENGPDSKLDRQAEMPTEDSKISQQRLSSEYPVAATKGDGDQVMTTEEEFTRGADSATARRRVSTAFLSLQDTFIHHHFFSWPYQICMVVDPRAEPGSDIGVWGWGNGMVCPRFVYIIPEETAK